MEVFCYSTATYDRVVRTCIDHSRLVMYREECRVENPRECRRRPVASVAPVAVTIHVNLGERDEEGFHVLLYEVELRGAGLSEPIKVGPKPLPDIVDEVVKVLKNMKLVRGGGGDSILRDLALDIMAWVLHDVDREYWEKIKGARPW